MTGNAFMNRLRFQLDFLSEEDTATVLSFYQKRIDSASTLEEEEVIVKSFGKPERIAAKLRASMVETAPPPSEKEEKTKSEASPAFVTDEAGNASEEKSESAEDPATKSEKEESQESPDSDEDDLIFSRPPIEAKTPEIVHALENPDIKPIYGEKVTLPEKADGASGLTDEAPSDIKSNDENVPSQEEIDAAKAKALEKAEEYGRVSFGEDEKGGSLEKQEEAEKASEANESANSKINDKIEFSRDVPDYAEKTSEEGASPKKEVLDEKRAFDENDFEEKNEAKKTPVRFDDSVDTPAVEEIQQQDDLEEELQEYPGILNTIFANSSMPTALVRTLQTLLVLLFSPLLLVAFILILCAYVIPTALISILAAVFALIMVVFIASGVIELVYGFMKLFESIPIGLIEIGVGTILFSIVVAIAGLIYEFLFGIVPKTLKKLTQLFKTALHRARCVIFGGKA